MFKFTIGRWTVDILNVELIVRERLNDLEKESARLALLSLVKDQQRQQAGPAQRLIALIGTQMVRLGTKLETYGTAECDSTVS
jgi:hypothetical protein